VSGPLVIAGLIANLVAGAVRIDGLPGTIVLLAPFILLLIVVAMSRRRRPRRTGTATASVLTAISSARTVIAEAAADASIGEEARPADSVAIDTVDAAAADPEAVATRYLELARREIADGEAACAADHLRASIRAAVKARARAVQAAARLELAELARASGDLTTACEHWQIARALFHDLDSKAELGETERLMQRHGCPTDWVLNDF